MTLAEQIEALRVRLADAHGNEMYLAARLKADVAAQDAAILAEIDAIFVEHEQQRANLAAVLQALAIRVGHLPSPTGQPAAVRHEPLDLSDWPHTPPHFCKGALQ